MSDDPNDFIKLNALRVEALYCHSIIPVAVMLCGAIILICILWNTDNALALITWFVILLLVAIVRGLNIFRYRSSENKPELYPYWLNAYFYGAVFSGVVWGSTAYVLLVSDNIVDAGLLVMFILVVAAGSIGIYSIFLRVYYGFNLPAVIPLIIYLLSRGDELLNMLGAITIVFIGFIFLIQYDAHKAINQLLVIKLNNRFLLDGYEEDQQKIRALEKQNRNIDKELESTRLELNIAKSRIEQLSKRQER